MPLQFLWEQITEFVIQEMLKLLSILIIALSFTSAYGQDSTMAVYINSQINKIEDRIQESFRLVKDTVLYDEGDSIRRPADALMLRTEYYINNFNQVEKICEKSKYRHWTTEIVVYYLAGQPLRFTTKQWDNKVLKLDFDVYFQNNNSVYQVKRLLDKGDPNTQDLLKWCYELLKR